MLEDNEMKFLVDALNVMPDKTVLVPKFFQTPTDKRQIAEIRFILTKAIRATDKPHVYKITVQYASGELGIKRNDEILSAEEKAQKSAEKEHERLSKVDPRYLEWYAEYWELREKKLEIIEEILKEIPTEEEKNISRAIFKALLDQEEDIKWIGEDKLDLGE